MRYYDGSLVNGPQFHFRCLERAQDPFGTSLPAPSGISIRADLETGFDHLDSSILGLITASFSMGSMLAILFVPYATDILGRQTGVVIIIMPVALICMGFYIAVHCWQSCPRLRHRHRTRIFLILQRRACFLLYSYSSRRTMGSYRSRNILEAPRFAGAELIHPQHRAILHNNPQHYVVPWVLGRLLGCVWYIPFSVMLP